LLIEKPKGRPFYCCNSSAWAYYLLFDCDTFSIGKTMPPITFDPTHALPQMAARGITQANVRWCIAGNQWVLQPNGRYKYRRYFDGGRSSLIVIVRADYHVITAMIRGRMDNGHH